MKFLLVLLFPAFAFAVPNFSDSVPSDIKNQMIQDLDLVKSLQGTGTSRLFGDIFGSTGTLDGAVLSNFFNKRVLDVDLDDCGGGAGVAACVYGAGSTMYLTNNFIKADLPQVFRISVIFHESRHTERNHGGWSHATCPTPYLDEQGKDIVGIISGTKMEGKPACDVVATGSYGLQAILLKNIENTCANCSEKMKMDGQVFGDDTIMRISNLGVRQLMRDDLQKK